MRRDNVEYHRGAEDREAGKSLASNPYTAGGERAARWEAGWTETTDGMPRCEAVCAIEYSHQVPLTRLCQNTAVRTVGRYHLCGTHTNAAERGEIRVCVSVDLRENF